MWEYKRHEEEGNDISEMVKNINDLGKDGWEVIKIDEENPYNKRKRFKFTAFLKRRIEEQTEEKQILND